MFVCIIIPRARLSTIARNFSGAVPRQPWLVREQIQLVRALGIHGYSLFCDRSLSPEIVEMLSTGLNREPAVPYFR